MVENSNFSAKHLVNLWNQMEVTMAYRYAEMEPICAKFVAGHVVKFTPLSNRPIKVDIWGLLKPFVLGRD